ncbi:unnamed protein product [Pleuronectes platessa]|uniref:Uncharacterized protein n=1 Tax=Pleuronectes platessa TaxID=8262 RepID=A0A9N7UHE7_PLEPL|nr:unnamed protein product [Pleuronectes platessa]
MWACLYSCMLSPPLPSRGTQNIKRLWRLCGERSLKPQPGARPFFWGKAPWSPREIPADCIKDDVAELQARLKLECRYEEEEEEEEGKPLWIFPSPADTAAGPVRSDAPHLDGGVCLSRRYELKSESSLRTLHGSASPVEGHAQRKARLPGLKGQWQLSQGHLPSSTPQQQDSDPKCVGWGLFVRRPFGSLTSEVFLQRASSFSEFVIFLVPVDHVLLRIQPPGLRHNRYACQTQMGPIKFYATPRQPTVPRASQCRI